MRRESRNERNTYTFDLGQRQIDQLIEDVLFGDCDVDALLEASIRSGKSETRRSGENPEDRKAKKRARKSELRAMKSVDDPVSSVPAVDPPPPGPPPVPAPVESPLPRQEPPVAVAPKIPDCPICGHPEHPPGSCLVKSCTCGAQMSAAAPLDPPCRLCNHPAHPPAACPKCNCGKVVKDHTTSGGPPPTKDTDAIASEWLSKFTTDVSRKLSKLVGAGENKSILNVLRRKEGDRPFLVAWGSIVATLMATAATIYGIHWFRDRHIRKVVTIATIKAAKMLDAKGIQVDARAFQKAVNMVSKDKAIKVKIKQILKVAKPGDEEKVMQVAGEFLAERFVHNVSLFAAKALPPPIITTTTPPVGEPPSARAFTHPPGSAEVLRNIDQFPPDHGGATVDLSQVTFKK